MGANGHLSQSFMHSNLSLPRPLTVTSTVSLSRTHPSRTVSLSRSRTHHSRSHSHRQPPFISPAVAASLRRCFRAGEGEQPELSSVSLADSPLAATSSI
ncbi:hypothetical protein WN943_017182 [Citrus x changshan-huyou]